MVLLAVTVSQILLVFYNLDSFEQCRMSQSNKLLKISNLFLDSISALEKSDLK